MGRSTISMAMFNSHLWGLPFGYHLWSSQWSQAASHGLLRGVWFRIPRRLLAHGADTADGAWILTCVYYVKVHGLGWFGVHPNLRKTLDMVFFLKHDFVITCHMSSLFLWLIAWLRSGWGSLFFTDMQRHALVACEFCCAHDPCGYPYLTAWFCLLGCLCVRV